MQFYINNRTRASSTPKNVRRILDSFFRMAAARTSREAFHDLVACENDLKRLFDRWFMADERMKLLSSPRHGGDALPDVFANVLRGELLDRAVEKQTIVREAESNIARSQSLEAEHRRLLAAEGRG